MKKPPADLFSRPPLLIVRVTPRGLRLLPTEETIEALEGHVISHGPQRKLFLEGILACHSDDAVTAKDGKRCQDCLHPLCRPQLRLRLANREAHYVLDSGRHLGQEPPRPRGGPARAGHCASWTSGCA